MAYARFSKESNVYIYFTNDHYHCCACWLRLYWECAKMRTPEEAAKHMQEHVIAGHKVAEELLNPETFKVRQSREDT